MGSFGEDERKERKRGCTFYMDGFIKPSKIMGHSAFLFSKAILGNSPPSSPFSISSFFRFLGDLDVLPPF